MAVPTLPLPGRSVFSSSSVQGLFQELLLAEEADTSGLPALMNC